MQFINRSDAGKRLGVLLKEKYTNEKCIIYPLPLGGVELGVEIATMLNAPFIKANLFIYLTSHLKIYIG